MLGALLGPGRRTVTNLICSRGAQAADWTADYRLYSKDRVDESVLFGRVRDSLLDVLPKTAPLVVGLDDTILRKTGTRIHGSGWKRDPLGPPFQTNLVRAQRYLQFSAAWPLEDGQARMVPVDFVHAPSPPKPNKKAGAAQHEAYREALKQQNLNAYALKRIGVLRHEMPSGRHLVLTGDGSFTNKTILRGLPEDCTYIGRTRKDLSVHYPPDGPPPATGRRPSYGRLAPTPEELRQDESVPWQRVEAFASGKRHSFRIKTIGPVLWRKTGAKLPLRMVVIAPVGYRLRKGSKMLYRKPAYLLCTDPDLPLEELLQDYLWRWGIEVNFRDEKTLLGTGEAQVRTEPSNQHLPAVSVAAYALLWTAALKAWCQGTQLPCWKPPKWRSQPGPERKLPSTGDLLRILRIELLAGAIRPDSFYHFATHCPPDMNAEKLTPSLPSILFDAA
jgi:hypothetical protein